MLTELYIQNYLFVPEERIEFGAGMTVLSGETGAGKSILVGAIALIFGNNSSALEPFNESKPIYLEASFNIAQNSELQNFLQEQGHKLNSEITLAREIKPSGKSTYFLNGRKVTASFLREMEPLMIDFHHQRDQQRLLSNAYQLQLLDLYAQNSFLKNEYALLFHSLKLALKELEKLKAEEEKNRQLKELYQYQFNELEKANLKLGEDEELQKEFELLSNAQELIEIASNAYLSLYESEDNLHSRLAQVINSLASYTSIYPRLSPILESLRDCLEQISSSALDLNDISQSITHNPQRLQEIQLRLDDINSLLYKHRTKNIAELVELFKQRESQINAMEDLGAQIIALETNIQQNYEKLITLGNKLTESRQKAAESLAIELQDNIRLLSIPDALFQINIDKKTTQNIILEQYLSLCSEEGEDICQFLFSANRGSDLKPLSAVASGGELSRILLAIKKVLSERMEEKLIILDEIDVGIGGKTADYVAQFIYQLAQHHRIICITHLAQIAAIANQQLALQKVPGKHKNIIRIIPLEPKQRKQELARMLAGDISEISLKHAEELMAKYK
ncbi:MAG: DNA repair protein RecN [Candidatus Cloacimonetes bacterium]|jgi:DNA repair protein RecN (Recombination protein N)|nr:DNA repair protein RecN [Candidatus Cloacimonadota bacterium]